MGSERKKPLRAEQFTTARKVQPWWYRATNGVGRAFARLGYGFYELFTFHCPTYHGTYKPPYAKCGQDWRIEMNPTDGLSEFPPELGAESYFSHTRRQKY